MHKIYLLRNPLRKIFGVAAPLLFTYHMYPQIKCYAAKNYDDRNVHVLNHKNKDHLLSIMRDKDAATSQFRIYTDRIVRLLLEDFLGDEPTVISRKQAPTLEYYDHVALKNTPDDYCVVTILRAADSMLKEVFTLLPGVDTGKILLQRDHKNPENTIFHFKKFPKNIHLKKRVILMDPMLGTGNSAVKAIGEIIDAGVKEENIAYINIMSCSEGLTRVLNAYPKVKIYTVSIEPILNDKKYLLPGIGDFGDRYFGTV